MVPTSIPVIVTAHAIERYVERIGGNEENARTVLSGRAIQIAADFGARVVRIAGGRIVMRFAEGNAVVVTVLPFDPGRFPQQLVPESWGGPPPSRAQLAPFHPALEIARG